MEQDATTVDDLPSAFGEGDSLAVTEVPGLPVRWVDLDLASAGDPSVVIKTIFGGSKSRIDSGLEPADLAELIDDLAKADEWPEVGDYGSVHKLSLAWMIPPRSNPGKEGDVDRQRPLMLDVARVEIAVGDGWILSAWHPVKRLTEPSDPRQPLSADLSKSREVMTTLVTAAVARRSLVTAGDVAVAMMAAGVSTFAEHRKLLHGRIDDWEHDFYREHFSDESRTAAKSESAKAARERAHRSTKTLAEVHAAAVDLSRELDQMTAPREQAAAHWAGEGKCSQAGEALAEVIDEKIDRQRMSLRDLRDRVRAGLDLAHTVDSTRRDTESRKRDSFIAKIAAVFLAPTLIAGFYGINTKYPDVGTTNGTLEAVALMILSAVGAWAGIEWFERRRGE